MAEVQTVLGKVPSSELGVILPHEHILVDFSKGIVPHPPLQDGREIEGLSLTMGNMGLIRRFPYSVRANLVLDEVEKAKQEVGLYKAAGGGCVCEMSVVGMRREAHDLADLASIATATGVHIVSATGFYSEGFLSAEVKAMSVQTMAEFMMGEIMKGCGGSEFKCGVMYVACSDPLKETERKALEAAAITHKHTGVSMQIAPGRTPERPFEILDLLTSHGVPGRVISMSHMERIYTGSEPHLKLMSQLCQRGCYINHSLFSKNCSHYQYNRDLDFPSDAQRIQRVKGLFAMGCGDRLLISHDVVCRHEWTKYGGCGYAHLLEHVVPKFLERGVDQDTLDTILIKNPQNWLTCS